MRQSARLRSKAIAMGIAMGLGAVTAAAWPARADERPVAPGQPAVTPDRLETPTFVGEESGTPPQSLRLRAIVTRAWDDSVATWKRLIHVRAAEIDTVNLRFVSRLGPSNCYGLYAGEGPAYCSGNQTVFVGTNAATRLMSKFGPEAEIGITFLIGHEMGHHIQNVHGRFHLLNHIIARAPGLRADLVRRFELQADCYAGVWIHGSEAWARSKRFRIQLRRVLASIGDEQFLGEKAGHRRLALAAHGTSEQRTRWFTRGAESGDWRACDTFAVARP